jgi:ABC-type phosphate transport system substrate-binding protein
LGRKTFFHCDDATSDATRDIRLTFHPLYYSLGSGPGQSEFTGASNGYAPLNHFGSGDIPFDADEYKALATDNSKEFFQIPFVIGGIAFFHSVPDSFGEIDLDACTLAKIFKRDITRWNDPAITISNPGLNIDKPITVVHRVGGSSSTSLITKYLRLKCPEVWPADMVGKTLTNWPTDTLEAEGSGGVTSYLAANPYTISYIDSGHGIASGLGEISLLNAAGKYVRSSTDGAIASAASNAAGMPSTAATYKDSWAAVTLMDQAGDASWPICTFSYLYIRKDMSGFNNNTAALVRAFALLVLSDEAQAMLPDFGFVGIPADMRTLGRAAVDIVTPPGSTVEWKFETKTNFPLNMQTMVDSSTAFDGNGERVFSGKRMAYADYERGAMVKQIAALEAAMTTMQTAHAALHPSAWYNDPQTEIDGAAAVGALGFILGFIGIVLGAVAMTRIKGLAKNSGGGYAI